MKRVLLCLIFVGMSASSFAALEDRRAALDKVRLVDEFRVFYSLHGIDRLPNPQDLNGDGVPDYVARIMDELVKARNVYDRDLHLTHPLRSKRYVNRAKFIDVSLLRFPLTEGGPKHGTAYDEISTSSHIDGGQVSRVLSLDISNELADDNRTPAHELFHLYQDGYTFFKNRWYTEGTARWVESLFGRNEELRGPLPSSLAEVTALFGKAYEAHRFWSAVAYETNPEDNGRNFIRPFLEELDRIDDQAFAERGLSAWSEKQQTSHDNDKWIWRALQNTISHTAFQNQRHQVAADLSKLHPN